MSQRIERLKGTVHPDIYVLCIEKARLITESYKETEGEPVIIRRAKALANILDKITIFIEDGELIVGNTASKPMGVELDFFSAVWDEEAIDGLLGEVWGISEAELAELKAMNAYWKGKTWNHAQGRLFDDERLWPFMQTGIAIPPWKSREEGFGPMGQSGIGLIPGVAIALVDYGRVLNGGLNQIIKEAEEELRNARVVSADAMKKVEFLQATVIAHKAVIRFASRFAVLAAEMASKEKDPVRKRELERIAATCQWVPANPARDFHEAMQSFWFIFLMQAGGVTPLGRFDQLMYRFYKKDIEEGRITDDEVLELLQCLRIKDMQINIVTGKAQQREKWAGLAKWNNMIIGGQTADGKDATNELSYLILEAAKLCPTPHHTITLRVHDGTPEALMLKALEVVKTGIGMPAFISDKSYIEYLLNQGVPLKLARDYTVAGCLDVAIMGRSRAMALVPFIVPLVFDIFMHNGVEPRTGKQIGPRTGDLESFESFDDLMTAWKEHLAYFMGLLAEFNNIFVRAERDIMPDAFISSLMVNAIKEGKDYFDRAMPFENAQGMMAIGMINIADSLAAIKKLVFDEKKVTMKELKAALAANWQGNGYEEMRKMFLATPKFGNDNDYVDSIAKELFEFWADKTVTFDTFYGGKHKPSAVSITAHWPGGALTGATPDGRYAGEVLGDGTVSPVRGRDTHGPTAVIKSAAKIDHTPYQSTLLNMKFHPSALQSTEDLRKLSDLIRIYFSLGGKHVQFNVVGKETLLDAQKHPENYRNLVVRVAGYSAYFVQLGKPMQDEIIGRMEYEKTV